MFARTDRLLLRPIWPEDAGELYRAIADEAIVRNLARAPWPYTYEEAVRFATINHDERLPSFMLMLRTDGPPRLIGACGLGDRNGEAELGYWIARSCWGLGFATEAGRAVINIAQTIGHRKLVAGHFTDNPASGAVLRKLGFRDTGRREQRYSKGRNISMTSALYEKSLDADGENNGPLRNIFVQNMRDYFERTQAA